MITKGSTPSIYIFRAVGAGKIKVGISDDVERRLKEVAAMSPVPVELIRHIPGSFNGEAFCHYLLRDYRSHGEWFEEHQGLAEAHRMFDLIEKSEEIVASIVGKFIPECATAALLEALLASGNGHLVTKLRPYFEERLSDEMDWRYGA